MAGDRAMKLPGPTAIVFSAGVARSAAEVGMLEVALQAGVKPDLVVGSSFGAVNAAAVAVDPAECVRKLTVFWGALAADKAWTSRLRGVWRAVTAKQPVRAGELLRAHLEALLGEATLDGGPTRGCCVATDLITGLAREFDTGSAVEAALAAAAVPLLLPAVVSLAADGGRVGNSALPDAQIGVTKGIEVLVDGGVVAGAPIQAALDRGAKSVVLLDVGASSQTVESIAAMRWYEVGLLAYAHVIRGQTASALLQAANQIPVVVLSDDSGDLIDFKATADLIKRGRVVAKRRLSSLPQRVSRPGIYGMPVGMQRDRRLIPLVRG